MEGVCKSVHTGRLFVMLDIVGDSSSHFFAGKDLSVDELREGKRDKKRRMIIICIEHGRTCVLDLRP